MRHRVPGEKSADNEHSKIGFDKLFREIENISFECFTEFNDKALFFQPKNFRTR